MKEEGECGYQRQQGRDSARAATPAIVGALVKPHGKQTAGPLQATIFRIACRRSARTTCCQAALRERKSAVDRRGTPLSGPVGCPRTSDTGGQITLLCLGGGSGVPFDPWAEVHDQGTTASLTVFSTLASLVRAVCSRRCGADAPAGLRHRRRTGCPPGYSTPWPTGIRLTCSQAADC